MCLEIHPRANTLLPRGIFSWGRKPTEGRTFLYNAREEPSWCRICTITTFVLLVVINFALVKEEIDLNVRHKNPGVDGSPLGSQTTHDLEAEEGGSKCG